MLILLGLLVCCAVTYTLRHILKHGVDKAIAIVATVCAVSLSSAFLFFIVVLTKADPVLKTIHTDLTSAMVVGALAMAAAALICACTAMVCLFRRIEGWIGVFSLLAATCAAQGGYVFSPILALSVVQAFSEVCSCCSPFDGNGRYGML